MKDYIRDYATAAFRFYAQKGRSTEKLKQKIYIEALEAIEKNESKAKCGISKPTEAALIAAENALQEKMSEILDMESVDKVMAELEAKNKMCILGVIEMVYFEDADKDLCLGDIKNRVTKASMEIHADVRTIYRWLKQARDLFAHHRGLRIKVVSNKGI